MNFIRRASRQNSDRGLSEDDLRALRQQRRKSSIAVAQTISSEEPLFVQPITPSIAIFPFSTYNRQQTLIISPDPIGKDYTVIRASTADQFLTISTPSLSIPAQSHAKQFFGRIPKRLDQDGTKNKEKDANDINPCTENDTNHSTTRANTDINANGTSTSTSVATDAHQSSSHSQNKSEDATAEFDGIVESPHECPVRKLFTLERDALSLRRRHHVTDPYSGKKLLQMEFAPVSSWNAQALKANVELLNRYSTNAVFPPVRLRWQGKKHSIEGVLEVVTSISSTSGTPVAVCAKGEETAESGDYILYVAPGMDACVAVCVVMAVDDRTRRGSGDETYASQARASKEDDVVWAEGYE